MTLMLDLVYFKKIIKITERDPICSTYIPIDYFDTLYTLPSNHTRLMSRTSRIKAFCWASINLKTSIGLKLTHGSLRFFLT